MSAGALAGEAVGALDLERSVRAVLEQAYGWVGLDGLLDKLPAGQRNSDAVEELLFQLADRNVVRLNLRPGRNPLVEYVRPGYTPTAEVRPDPPPGGKVKFVGDVVSLQAPPPPRRPTHRTPHLSPAKPPATHEGEDPMPKATRRSHEQIEVAVLGALKNGPVSSSDLQKRAGVVSSVLTKTCKGLLARKAIERGPGRKGLWTLPGQQPASGLAATPQRKAAGLNGRDRAVARLLTRSTAAVQDLHLKTTALEEAAKAASPLAAAILREIRKDLERLGAAA